MPRNKQKQENVNQGCGNIENSKKLTPRADSGNMEKRGVIGAKVQQVSRFRKPEKPRQKLMFPLVNRLVHGLEQSRLQGYVPSTHSG